MRNSPHAVKLWDRFQGGGGLRCRRCHERTPLAVCDWREGRKDCMTGVCPACGFRAEGLLLCDEHAARYLAAAEGAQAAPAHVN